VELSVIPLGPINAGSITWVTPKGNPRRRDFTISAANEMCSNAAKRMTVKQLRMVRGDLVEESVCI
jgi:hypothetical protein